MYYVGIDLGGTNIAAGIMDESCTILKKGSVPTGRERPYGEIIRDMAMLANKLIEETGVPLDQVAGIGVGSPGTPNCKDGVLVYNNNLNFINVPIRTEIQKYINLPVYIENDANCAALAESAAGAAKGIADSMTITIGTGIGSGVVIGGRIFSGFNNAAAELGHTVICVDGEECTCGRKGCWEAYASATALIRQTRRAMGQNPSSKISALVGGDDTKINAKTVFDAAKEGDVVAKAVIEQYIHYLAEGLINAINIFQPEVTAIGGGVCKEGEYLLEPLRKEVLQNTYGREHSPQTTIKVAQMENDAGIIGAGMLAK